MRHVMTTRNDLRNWVDQATSNWDNRTDADVDFLTDGIQWDDERPRWGTDWTEFLESLDLIAFLPATDALDK